jgi:multidrug efflux pump
MTSFAFILGVVPMVVAEGAGSEMRWSLGTAVFSGMIGVTLFGIFLTPVFFYVIVRLNDLAEFQPMFWRRIGSVTLGGGAGLAGGYLAYRAGFPHLNAALSAGFILGTVIALWVSAHARRRTAQATQKSTGV